MSKTDFFPRKEIGLWANIVKYFRFMNITKGEYVFKAGETVEGIYFILEGSVLLLSPDEKAAVTHLGKNDIFGELFAFEESLKVHQVFLLREIDYIHTFKIEKCTSDSKHIVGRIINWWFKENLGGISNCQA